MAASILRLGRLGSVKWFQSQGWIIWRNRSVASFCSQAAEPPKRPKKAPTASKTVAPDERASLLAYRTAVAFPVKVSDTPVLPVQPAGGAAAASVAGGAAAGSGSAVSAEPRADPQTSQVTSKPADEAVDGSSSSSSSSSDSDSDSDSDDELSEAKAQPSEPAMKHESGGRKVTSKVKDDAGESKPKYDRRSAGETDEIVVPPEVGSEGTRGAAAAAAGAGAEEPGTSPESTEDAVSPAGPDVSAEDVSTASPLADESAVGTKGSSSAGSPEALAEAAGAGGAGAEAAGAAGAEAAGAAGAEAAGAVGAEAAGAEAAGAAGAEAAGAEAAEVLEGPPTPAGASAEPAAAGGSEASASAESSEELVDAAAGGAESVGEELQPEEAAAAAAAAPPEPEEPLDISTYKNYQHHSYHPFTFADMDVEMAKYRLPQPTANRH